MQVIIQASTLKDNFSKILSVVDKRNSRPILTYCMISADEDTIELSATDLEVSAKVKLNAQILEKGAFCINAKSFFDILKEMPNDEIKLSIDDNENILKLSCDNDNINFSLLIFRTDEFPHLSFGNNYSKFHLKGSALQMIISKIVHAILSDEVKILFNGIYLQQKDGNLRAVATDGYRLALMEIKNFQEKNDFLSQGIIIPRKGVNEIKRLADCYSDEDIEISVDESFIYLNAKDLYHLSIRLVSREYPSFQSVIPASTTYQMSVDKSVFLTSLRRVRTLASERSNGIKFSIRKGHLTMTANRPSLGDAKEKINIIYEGADLDISFNAKYVIDTVSILEEGLITFEFNHESSPALIKSENVPHFLGLIMPIKL